MSYDNTILSSYTDAWCAYVVLMLWFVYFWLDVVGRGVDAAPQRLTIW